MNTFYKTTAKAVDYREEWQRQKITPYGVESKLELQQHKMTKRAKGQASKTAGRLPEQEREFQPHHRDQPGNCSGGLAGNPGWSAFCPRRGCLQLFLLLITTPHTKEVSEKSG